MKKTKSKPKNQIEDPVKEEVITTTPSIYTQERRLQIEALMKVIAPTNAQIALIYELYKLFVNPLQVPPDTRGGCSSCGNGISRLYWELLDFYKQNKHKFQ